MAFHVACPITCRRICDCELGFPASLRGGGRRAEFADEIARLEEFLRDPWCLRPGDTVQVSVPRVDPPPAVPAEDAEEAAAASAKRSAMQHQAAAASLAAEDYVRRLEAVGAAEVQGEEAREDQVSSATKVMCRICFSGESEGSEKAVNMLSCKFCSKKYHRSCLKNWAEHRDLFNWSSWACPSCRICEVCRRSGDPNRLMYCKRCDAAYHCYCQQPSHKNVSHGPYLCPKHTRCHSCGSNVPGSGLSTRWFLGYTCCDACGRLFSKGNYCPVCLKVYRDSEITPMVCCDVCQKWVHCQCDGISDEKYQEFQADQNLLYKCATCRGNCYKVRDLDDAVRELWKRKDEADRDLIATLRVAAGLPPQQENSSTSPYSDDEQNGPVLKKDYAQPLKLSLSVKGLSDKSAKNVKETKLLSPSKKNLKKKGYQIKFVHKSEDSFQNVERQYEARSFESCFGDNKIGGLDGPEVFSSSAGSKNGKFVREVVVNNFDRVSTEQSKGKKLQGLQIKESAGRIERKSDSSKTPKLVIHLGGKARNASNSPRSETSSCHRDQDISASYGREDTKKPKAESRENGVLGTHVGVAKLDDGRGARFDDTNQSRHSKHGHREKSTVKLGKVSDINGKRNNNVSEEAELTPIREMPSVKGKRSRNSDFTRGTVVEGTQRNEEPLLKKQLKFTSGNLQSESRDTSQSKLIPNVSSDLRPLLKLKFKNPYLEHRSSWAPNGEEENSVKGQRSKRKRPSADKNCFRESVSYGLLHPESHGDEAMEAKILLKLGKGAVGKRIEVHQSSDNSWRPGVVSGTIEGSSSLIVQLDDGATTTLELGRHGVRFVEQKKQKKAHR